MTPQVTVIRTGTANTASVVAALERAGCEVRVSAEPAAVAAADRLVLPGVGSFGPVAVGLRERGLAEPLAERFASDRPSLAICLGLQLLAQSSEEDEDVGGLGVLPTTVVRFRSGLRVPQLGWNRLSVRPDCRLLSDGAVYFANSYVLDRIPEGWTGATADHGGDFVAAIERGPVLACQFHPELSGAAGQALLERWLAC